MDEEGERRQGGREGLGSEGDSKGIGSGCAAEEAGSLREGGHYGLWSRIWS